MKKIILLFITLAVMFVTCASAQSLADVAKQTRARQKANPNARVIDNDVIPSNPGASASPAPAASASTSSDATSGSADTKKDETAKQDAGKENKEDKAGSEKSVSADDDKKNIDAWKKQINDQKKEIS